MFKVVRLLCVCRCCGGGDGGHSWQLYQFLFLEVYEGHEGGAQYYNKRTF